MRAYILPGAYHTPHTRLCVRFLRPDLGASLSLTEICLVKKMTRGHEDRGRHETRYGTLTPVGMHPDQSKGSLRSGDAVVRVHQVCDGIEYA